MYASKLKMQTTTCGVVLNFRGKNPVWWIKLKITFTFCEKNLNLEQNLLPTSEDYPLNYLIITTFRIWAIPLEVPLLALQFPGLGF